MIVGIDPSLSRTSVVIGDVESWTVESFSTKSCGGNVQNRIDRYDDLVHRIVGKIQRYTYPPVEAIFIEGYAFSRNGSGARYAVEFGGILRWHLVDLSPKVIEVAPTTLKKFVTGKGNAPKDTMLAHIQKRWDVLFDSNDEGDAFGLYKLGLVVEGLAKADNQAQREAAAKVRGQFTKPCDKGG